MKKLTLPALFILTGLSAGAQKLGNVQKAPVALPASVKIDGKATEWDNKFEAYNKATEVFYTMANSNETLYLVVQAKYHDIVDKILRGGLTLTINPTLKRGDKDAISVSYPVLRDQVMADVSNLFARKSNEKRDANGAAISPEELNTALQNKSKEIKLSGFKAIADPSISVYNEEGIKAVGLFDADLAYTYELAIPLKYLNFPAGSTGAFSYNIKINEPPMARVTSAGGPPPPPVMVTQLSTTDFWGEYTLLKK